jgi:hypothetical protein
MRTYNEKHPTFDATWMEKFFYFFLVWMSGPSSRQVFFIGKIFVHVFSLLSNQLDGKI